MGVETRPQGGSSSRWEPPSEFEEYRIVRLLGRGAMGEVYLAHDALLDRAVAIKFLGALDVGAGARERFFTEARAVARLSHANVVAVHRVGEFRRRPYLVSEYVRGDSLDRIEKPVPWGRILKIGLGLARGLAAAHRHGVLHRDIKPANVVLGDGDEAKLLDFGLAKLLDAAVPLTRELGETESPSNPTHAELAATMSLQESPLRPASAREIAAGGVPLLVPVTQPLTAAGAIVGTPLYLAPEMWRGGAASTQSDVYALGVLLYELACGHTPHRGVPMADLARHVQDEDAVSIASCAPILPPALTNLIDGCISRDPAHRPASGEALCERLEALAREPPPELSGRPVERPPFRRLAPFTETDRGRLYGRDREVAQLAEQVLFSRAVVFTAPSGTGKTSILRAGLLPRLERMCIRVVYASSRSEPLRTIAAALGQNAETVADAVAAWRATSSERLVIILDQVETLLGNQPPEGAVEILDDVIALGRGDAEAEISTVIAVREDFLARLLGRTQRLENGHRRIIRLGPVPLDGARESIVRPLFERGLTIEPALLETLLSDLAAAAAVLGQELGWGADPAVYPPHLQLACAVLYEALGPLESTLTMGHYRRLGGFDAIVGEHLDRVLETELAPDAASIARDLFLALVTAAHTRAARTEAELLEVVTVAGGAERVPQLLETLHNHGLLVRTVRSAGEPLWELVHDSLVPRVQGWIDRQDLARRRAIELVRYHLRRSSIAEPSLLSRVELRELDTYPGALHDLEAEWTRRTTASGDGAHASWTPRTLVATSRRVLRRRRALAMAMVAIGIVAATGAVLDRRAGALAREREQSLRDRDLGHFALELAPFDWDAGTATESSVATTALSGLDWTLHEPDPEDPDSPGPPLEGSRLIRGTTSPSADGMMRIDAVDAPGGAAFLRITGRGRPGEVCPPSVVPLRSLPGYARRGGGVARLRVRVPTCQATRTGMIEVPAGTFVSGGVGDPPSGFDPDDLPEEKIVDLPAYWIDRTEVTNGAYRLFAGATTGVPMPAYPETDDLALAGGDTYPAADMTWTEARSYCQFLGKELPTAPQWEKAMRGGIHLGQGHLNPHPRRNLPWGAEVGTRAARVRGTPPGGPAPAGSAPDDESPLGVLDLAGNVQEWTDSVALPRDPTPDVASAATSDRLQFRFTRGCNWDHCGATNLVAYISIPNPRSVRFHDFSMGFRCALSD